MKVQWFVSNYPHEAQPHAGVFYKVLAEALVQQGVQLTVTAPVPWAPWPAQWLSAHYRQYAAAPKEEWQNGVHIVRPRYITRPGEAHRAGSYRVLWQMMKHEPDMKAQIVHAFGDYPLSRAAALYAQHLKLPLVITYIGSDVNQFPHRGHWQLQTFKNTAHMARKVLAVSNALAGEVQNLAQVQAEVVHMPAVLHPSPSNRESVRKHYGMADDEFCVLFAGNPVAEKGVPELLEALHMVNTPHRTRALFAGPSSTLISRIDETPGARWVGLLKPEKLHELMPACDVLVLPSHSEGIPGVVKEAGLAGLPVICSRAGGTAELVNDERGYLLPEVSAQAIAGAISHTMHHREEAAARAQQLREFVNQHFSPEACATKQIMIYQSLLSNL